MNALKIFATTVLCFFLFFLLFIFCIAFTINNTVLNQNFVSENIKNFDLSNIIDSSILQIIGKDSGIPQENINILTDEVKATIQNNIDSYIKSIYDYFTGNNDKLQIVIALESIKEKIKTILLQQTLDKTMAELKVKELSEKDRKNIEQLFNDRWVELSKNIPSQIDITDKFLDPETENIIASVKQALEIYQTSFIILLVTIVLFIFLIIILNLNLKTAPRILGIIIFTVGLIQLLASLFYGMVQSYLLKNILPVDLPDTVYQGVSRLINGIVAVFQTINIVFLVIGAVLIMLSIILPRVIKKSFRNLPSA